MTTQNDHIDQFIADFLCGELAAADRVELEQWIAAHPDNRDRFMRMREIWRASRADSHSPLGGFDADKAFQEFRMRCNDQSAAESAQLPPVRHTLRSFLGYAATLAIGIGATALFFLSESRANTLPDEYVELIAPEGSQSRVNLPDGSYVMLNGGSSLSYTTAYGTTQRDVKLSGEGYFSVAHDNDTPCTVDLDGAKVKVYGTTFTITSYPDDSIATVALIAGHLGMVSQRDTSERHITSGQTLLLDRATGQLAESPYSQSHADWTRGVLNYDHVPLSTLLRSLERTYGTTIVIADSTLGNMKVSAKFFRSSQSLDDVLSSLAATGRLHYDRTASGITIFPN